MDTQPTVKNFLAVILPAILVVFIIFFLVLPKARENREPDSQPSITTFEECVAAGNLIMESYPRQCRTKDGKHFTEQLPNRVGGDRDEHGCIGSAGYSWSEERESCVRVWEVPIMIEAENAVLELLAEKYDKPKSSITVSVTKIDTDHVAGSIRFSDEEEVPGGAFLAYKENDTWRLVYDGNGSVDCVELRETYGFSDLVLSPQFCD